ncbi:hypothetical protein F4819DRAFT_508040 [Hypoxylon fuscum]|nr:hypothetical protein F4819DRAFT_508040 [Hypoxylon fuscum]
MELHEDILAPPPPYSPEKPLSNSHVNSGVTLPASQPHTLRPWQRRWNREWLNNALMKEVRAGCVYTMSNRNGCSKECVKKKIAKAEEWVSRGIQVGVIDEKTTLLRSRLQRATDRLFGLLKPLKQEYDDFVEWRREMKNKDKLWKVTAVMEDVGENPKWQAEMTFKITPEQWSELEHPNQWFDFPSAENIKWLRVTEPNGYDHISPPAAENWGPDIRPKTFASIIPFFETGGSVIRNPQPGTPSVADGCYWHNFTDLARHGNSA